MTKDPHDARLTVLRRRVAKVSEGPGVYRWLDSDRTVLYVGKAKNLKNRMMSYVQDGPKRSAWTEIMVRQIADFEVSVVHSELEAFMLEANLIKELKPKYNIMLKDDKGYVYIRISKDEAYPRVDMVRRIGEDEATYFGPFTSGARSTEYALEMLDSILHFRACKASLDALNAGKEPLGTPCMDQQIGKCCGLCIRAVTHEDYRSRIADVARFFRGNFASVKTKTKEAMKRAAADHKFERAAKLRDALRFIEGLESKQIISDTSGDDADIFGIALLQGKTHVVLLKQRDGKIIDHVHVALKGGADSAAEALEQFLPQYYEQTKDIPPLIILGETFPEADSLAAWLHTMRGTKVSILVPERGKKSKLLLMAERNALEKVEQQFAAWEAEHAKVEGALRDLASLLHLSAPPRRIEGYDISHLGGTATVGSMVVMVGGKPKREHYRSFNMQTVQEGEVDDYKSLAETLRRRLRYLTADLKKTLASLKEKGIEMTQARKADVEFLASRVLVPVQTKEFFVARAEGQIVATAQLLKNDGGILEITSVWDRDDVREQKLSQHVIRLLLSKQKKGKIYTIIDADPACEEQYADIGFHHLHTPPDILAEKVRHKHENNPHGPPAFVLAYDIAKQKVDASFSAQPDLLLIDGGKGQLSVAVQVLSEAGLTIPVASLAKREEEIFLPSSPVSLAVPEGSEARFLLQRLRDEAHRFANDRRERRLSAVLTASKLDVVPGIGEATRRALLKKFGSADAVIATTDDVLRTVLSEAQVRALREKFPQV